MVIVLDATELDLGKNAYSQMKDFGVEAEVVETEPLDVPRRIAQSNEKNFLLILNIENQFASEIIEKVLDLEEDKHVEKVFVEKKNEGHEVFRRRAKRLTREKSEELAEKVR